MNPASNETAYRADAPIRADTGRTRTGKRGILAFLFVSFLASAYVAVAISPSPWGALQNGSDHAAHVGSAILFTHAGMDVYRTPTAELCHGDENHWQCPGREGRPLHINWSQFPRPYPPGAMLYAAPEAALYAWTQIPFDTLNRISVLKFLLASHVLLFLLWRILRDTSLWPRRTPEPLRLAVAVAVFFLIWCAVLQYALFGIYDSVAVIAVVLAAMWLARGRPVDAILAYSVGLFLHFRALWFAPLLVWAALLCLRNRSWMRSRAAWVKLSVSALLLAVTAWALWLVHPWLGKFPLTNPLRGGLGTSPLRFWEMLGLEVAAVALALWGRNGLLAACAVVQFLIIARTPQMMSWHTLFLLPFFAVATLRGGAKSLACALLLYFGQASGVFYAKPAPRNLYRPIIEQWRANHRG